MRLDELPRSEKIEDRRGAGGLSMGRTGERWSRVTGQNGGLAKVDSGFDYAANFCSLACVA